MRRNMILAISLTFAACRGDSAAPVAPPPPPPRIDGAYTLASVDGQALPLTVIDLGAYQVQLTSGALTLDSTGTYALELGLRTDDSGNIRVSTDSDSGIWYTVDDTLVLTSTAGDIRRVGTISRDTITLQSSIRRLVLRK